MTTETKTDQTEHIQQKDQKRLISLEVENVMRVKAVFLQFDPAGGLTIIGGDNGAGKTSTLKALEFAFRGGRSICEEPLRQGQKKGHVIVALGDMTVTRRFTGKTTSIKVEAKDGTVFSSPQAMLDKLVGQLGFNPLAFLTYRPDKQAETLRGLLGLDFSQLDAKRAKAYDDRLNVGRERDSLQGQLNVMTFDKDAPKQEVSISALITERDRRAEINQGNAQAAGDLDRFDALLDDHNQVIRTRAQQITELEAQLATIHTQLDEAEKRRGLCVTEHQQQAEKVRALVDENVDEITAQINSAESVNQNVRANIKWAEINTAHDAAGDGYTDLTREIDRIDQEKADMLAAAEFPIKGLGFSAEGVELNGLPFDQAGDAEQLQVSVAMGLAMNEGFKLLLIDGGERLDAKGIKIVEEMARDAGAFVLMSRVSQGDECSVIIKDGMVSDGKAE